MNKCLTTCLLAALLAGCGPSGHLDTKDERHPLVHKGLEFARMKQWSDAISSFQKALEKDARLARAHLELALIYHQQKKDYVRAVYHYECYLEKRPNSEKSAFIRQWIEQAKVSFAAELGQTSGDLSDDMKRLIRENNLLRKQVETLTEQSVTETENSVTVKTEPQPEVTPAPAIKLPPIATTETQVTPVPKPENEPRLYHVRAGDTLTGISKKMYGDGSHWRKIFEANRDMMRSENDIKIGQTLVIPEL
jgi:LysM repeat protein